jgi:hypothetical protein
MRQMKAFALDLMVDVIPVYIVVFDAEDVETQRMTFSTYLAPRTIKPDTSL